ncbi:type II secretion system minor pseudopilin GspK [Halieaceae bacterium]|nr:type II secretion system minor pseudopilin GspK [Halieaceae bacterium]
MTFREPQIYARQMQKGAAMVVALLVVALVAVLAVSLAEDFLLTLRRSGNAIVGEQNYAYLRGGELLAIEALRQDAKADSKNESRRDDYSEQWAQKMPPYELDSGWLSGELVDLQSRFNINSLAGRAISPNRFTAYQEQFIRLLQTFEKPALNEEDAIVITESLMDWLDSDSIPRDFGAEDGFYFDTVYAYRAANRPMASVTELRAVANVTPELYAVLAPHIGIWGVDFKINLHTATDNVLRSINAVGQYLPLNEAELQAMLAMREQAGFESLEGFWQLPVFSGKTIAAELRESFVETSDWFLFSAEVEVDERVARLYSVLYRQDDAVMIEGRSFKVPW